MPMLDVSGLTKRFGALRAVNEVSFEVDEGEILGLIGPNGSGKSTIFNCIAGTLRADGGTISFEGAEIAGLPPNRICHKGIGRTFQIPRPFRNLTLLENVALSAFFGQDAARPPRRLLALAEEALTLVGLPTDARTTTDGLGAAALKKLELARALATQPRLLLADESLNGLDHSEMEQAADMLQRIRREKGITIVWVEHIMGVLMRVVDRVVVLDTARRSSTAPPKEAQRDAARVEVYLGADARVRRSMAVRTSAARLSSSIDAGYGGFQALFGISMTVKAGEAVAVIGSNGAGKTTLLRVISGLLPADRRHDDHGRRRPARDAAAQDHRDRHRACARRAPAVSAPVGGEQPAIGAYIPAARAKFAERLEFVYTLFPRLKERRAQLAGTLSGGEQQMCAIAPRADERAEAGPARRALDGARPGDRRAGVRPGAAHPRRGLHRC